MSATVCLSSVHEAGGFGEAASRKQVHMIKHRAREKHALAQQVEKHLLSFFGESQKFFDGNVIDGRAIHRKVDNIQGFAVATLCLRHVLVARTANGHSISKRLLLGCAVHAITSAEQLNIDLWVGHVRVYVARACEAFV